MEFIELLLLMEDKDEGGNQSGNGCQPGANSQNSSTEQESGKSNT